MLIPLGQVSLFMAYLLAAVSAFGFGLAAARRDLLAARAARDALVGCAVALCAAVGVLTVGLVTHDFRLEYVARYTDSDVPLGYRLSALWAGAEGSLLFWTALAAVASAALALARPLTRWRAAAGAATSAVLLVLLSLLNVDARALARGQWPLVATPFAGSEFVLADGNGLALQLQTWAMAVHPPALFAGYAALVVPLAVAVANLVTGRPREHLGALRGFLLLGWTLLTLGNALGAWWAYTELGWGGYWSWDPVENASLVPWLVTTAALHSLAVTRRTGRLATTTLVTSVSAFLACILATYITRGGVLPSVHAYAAGAAGQENLLAWLLRHAYLILIAVSATVLTGLILWQRPWRVVPGAPAGTQQTRHPAAMLIVTIVLLVFAGGVLAGTVGPGILSRLTGESYSIPPEQFDVLGAVFGLLILGWLGAYPVVTAGDRDGRRRARGLRQAGVAAAAGVTALILGRELGPWWAPTAALVAAAVAAQVATARRAVRSVGHAAMWLAHTGLILVAIGLVGSHLAEDEKTFVLRPGQSADVAGYRVQYETLDTGDADAAGRHRVLAAELSVTRGDRLVTTLRPALRFDARSDNPRAEVAIRTGLLADLYVSLNAVDPDSRAAQFTFHRTALVLWLWIGAGLMAVAGLLGIVASARSRRTDGGTP